MYDYSGELMVILITIWWLQKVGERLAVSKQAAQKFDVERFNLGTLNERKVRKNYQIKILNRFAASENLNDDKDINSVLKNIKVNIKISAKESCTN